ncbi:MAG: Holliday junction resolvase RuvX [Gammaproteobacteria bacterium]|nr:Holliday junction resolvase RuvX [Gammaproteobacteria bacterium]MCY3815080.1 Holliday junction resolvase RuvX [Gammaproteobacteria bacterium]MDE0489512.1 Holliday junction resolvase RuvX [Gammaproteobacteria bacterium]MXW20805.1 Holliday junction resolvase RuvX [Gammaproteobacteria bacterium]MXZ28293.1 Holliday junction resolvase RuvX [Gammaproteobacteria bacterium]
MRTEPAIALDFGLKRVGVATATGGVITARRHLPARAGLPEWAELDRLVHDYGPQVLVLGCPPDPDPEFELALKRFRKHLKGRYGLAVETVQEHLTTREANAWLREQRSTGEFGRRARKGEVDSLAACLIARDWQEKQA